MDTSIRLRTTAEMTQDVAVLPDPNMTLPRLRTSTVKRIGGKLVRVAIESPPTTVASLREAILNCAASAIQAEPVDAARRLHSFIAKLSATMEGLGERELDTVLWNLMETQPDPIASGA